METNVVNVTDLPERKPRTKAAILAFLSGHFRYHTMNSWNLGTSYAVQQKISQLNLTAEQRTACYAMLDVEDSAVLCGYNEVLQAFDRRHDYCWQIGANGRSGGYLVLYQGGRKPSGYKSRCTECGGLNYQPVGDTPRDCGRCHTVGALRNIPETHMQIFSMPGRGMDGERDFEDWSFDKLKDRLAVVWDFDQTCEQACRCFLEFAMDHRVEEETIMVPRKIMVAVEK
jgi:hypothetical protein